MLVYPFSALVGQSDMTRALLIAAVDPEIGGVLVLGHRGTGKSTAVRALAGVLPDLCTLGGCPYNCDPASPCGLCSDDESEPRAEETMAVPVVDLPLGTTEDRLVGTIDLERALSSGHRVFEPGLLAKANRGFLYVDEINLLDDYLVDLLLDVAASGESIVEREGVSIRHPARFVLVGSGNPEEGDLRPQLLDRFGLSVQVTTPVDLNERLEVLDRRDAFDRDPAAFRRRWASADGRIRSRIERARAGRDDVEVDEALRRAAARLCITLGIDGLRGELTLLRAMRAWCAYEGRNEATLDDLVLLTPAVLGHRLRKDPLDPSGSETRIDRALAELADARG